MALLALLLVVPVARDCTGAASNLRAWCGEVELGSPGFVCGEVWRAPDGWRKDLQRIPGFLRAAISPGTADLGEEVLQGVAAALLELRPTLGLLPPDTLRHYLEALRAPKKERIHLRGVGGLGPPASDGRCKWAAPPRLHYLAPRLGRLKGGLKVAAETSASSHQASACSGASWRPTRRRVGRV